MENNACLPFLLELPGGTLFDTSEVARADDKLIDVSAFDVLEAREALFKAYLCDNETASSERGGLVWRCFAMDNLSVWVQCR